MIKRYYYWGNLLLMGGLCLSACGNKNPGVSKEELRREFAKSATPAADVDNAYFLSDWVETDSYVFMHVEKGYDCPYARDKKQVTLYSLIYDKWSKAFFSLPQAEETVHPCPEPDLPDGIPFWPPERFF